MSDYNNQQNRDDDQYIDNQQSMIGIDYYFGRAVVVDDIGINQFQMDILCRFVLLSDHVLTVVLLLGYWILLPCNKNKITFNKSSF